MRKQLKFNFNPFKEGLNQVMGTLERDIMEVLWNHGESSVKDIVSTLPQDRDSSYSTVITVTNRMAVKGLLKKRKMGKAYVYKPAYNREQFCEIVSKKVVEGVSSFSFQAAVAHFVDCMSQLEPDKLEYFSRLIESKRKNKP
ncbi:MAG: BlaI/MecI/CopY family transcriptional regulator [Candidatus Brocadiaceae bacterium]